MLLLKGWRTVLRCALLSLRSGLVSVGGVMHDSSRSLGHPGLDDVRPSAVAVAPRANAHTPPESECLAHAMRPNVLNSGPVKRMEATVASIVTASTPVCYWTPETPLPATGNGSTIVIRDVATLSLPLQAAWLAWLNALPARPPQIIATSSIA